MNADLSCGSGLKISGRACLLSGSRPVKVLTCHVVPGQRLVGTPVYFQVNSMDFEPWSAVQRSGANVVFQPEYFAEAGRRPRLWGLTCHVVPV